MIGDDLVNDVGGAQQCGMKGVQVRTGKYRSVKNNFLGTINQKEHESLLAAGFSINPSDYPLTMLVHALLNYP